ncbi:MAG: phosphoenolpyruvate carboxylase [Alphaproteobacteria bacterium]|nr:phosphoenolpyruvate carboxylase [Alphaproteobacteria bacterium]
MALPKSSARLAQARDQLRSEAERIAEDPQTNSVFAYARSVFNRLETGAGDLDEVEALIDEVHLRLALSRAGALREQHFQCAPENALEPLRERLAALCKPGWPAFQDAVETPTGGLVFTAHPTFALPRQAREALAGFAETPTQACQAKLAMTLSEDARDGSAGISLTGEHEEVQHVLANARQAMAAYGELVFTKAREAFPQTWRELRPALPTLASWVGYDLDGRTDIDWWQSVALRLSEKSGQLAYYAGQLEEIGLKRAEALAARLRQAAELSAAESALFGKDLSEPDTLIDAVRHLTGDNPARIVDAQTIIDELDEMISEAGDDEAGPLLVLRAQVDALQLGTARIHLRVNAAQVRAVISRDLGLETEDRDLGRLALQQLSQKAGERHTQAANFADLFLEQSTARRQIMMSALWLKHIDAGSPIRFLIAEAENPATVMGALYLARQFGIDDRLDISPLFETPEALETGGRFIERLLQEPEFVAYLRTRGHLSIQLGFSDAGRFIGQVAADMAIERIHNLIARAIAKVDGRIGLLIFNTHGESMGRGAWPGPFEQRLEHVLTSWTRRQARLRGVPLRHEVSFQGGDGFLHFATPALAATSYGAWYLHVLSEPGDGPEDPFYVDTDFTWDTYRALRAWHERLFEDRDYARLLNDFATNLLVRAGSRQKRRSGGPRGPRALRAISHNATLQQLGVPVNTAAGLGSAIRRENERLIALLDRSPRMRSLLELALQARLVTSVPALRAYGEVYDPSFWVAISRHADPRVAAAYRRVYYALGDGQTSQSIRRIADRFSIDLGKFDRLLAALEDAPSAEDRHEGRLDLHVLHGLRLAMMMHAFALAGRLPSLSGRHDARLEDFMTLILEMQIADAVALLEEAFPRTSPNGAALAELRETPDAETRQGYDDLHRKIITPLAQIAALTHKTTLAISQAYRAYG